MGGAERFDDAAGSLEMDARHGGKEVVFDLVVESTEQEIPKRVRGDVARAEHLPLQEREPGSSGPHGHPLMIGCDDCNQVEARYDLAPDEHAYPSPAKDYHQCSPQ